MPGHREAGHFINVGLTAEEHAKNNLPDVAEALGGAGRRRAQAPAHGAELCVPKAEIAAAGYDLSINRYKEVEHEAVEHRPPKEIIAELKALETEIAKGLDELEAML